MQDEVADDGGGEEAGEGQDVGERVDVFVRGEGGEEAVGEFGFWGRGDSVLGGVLVSWLVD